MIIDDDKAFLVCQDNEDGTLTMTFRLPEILGDEMLTIVAGMSLMDMVKSMLPDINPDAESYRNFEEKAVYIPNSAED